MMHRAIAHSAKSAASLLLMEAPAAVVHSVHSAANLLLSRAGSRAGSSAPTTFADMSALCLRRAGS